MRLSSDARFHLLAVRRHEDTRTSITLLVGLLISSTVGSNAARLDSKGLFVRKRRSNNSRGHRATIWLNSCDSGTEKALL